jgi:hypothetical protein
LCLLLVTACGSTVPTAVTAGGQPGAAGADGLGAGAGAPAPAAASGVAVAAPQSGSRSRQGSSLAGSGSLAVPDADPADGGAPVTSAGSSSVVNGPGVTAKTIAVGVFYAKGAAEYQAALGGSTAGQVTDVEAVVDAIVRDINAHGGAAGRRMSVVYHATEAASSTPYAAQNQAACSDFTDDHPVLVALKGTRSVLPDDAFVACMQKAGAVVAGGGAYLADRDYARFSSYYDLADLATNRVATNLIDALVRSRYFTGWDTANGRPGSAPAKVGIVTPDTSDWSWTVSHVLVPGLAQRGFRVDPGDISVWHYPDSTSDNGQAVSQIQSAVLKFRSDGVTHVLPVEQNSASFFATAAEGQHYRPRYGVNSRTAFEIEGGTLVPRAQMVGAVGFGWVPVEDLPAAMTTKDTGPYAGPGRVHCVKVLTDAGFTPTDARASVGVCDALYSIQRTLNALPAGAAVTARSFMSGLEGLGGGFEASGLPAWLLGAGRHYPATRAWLWAHDPGCDCMSYTGSPYQLR